MAIWAQSGSVQLRPEPDRVATDAFHDSWASAAADAFRGAGFVVVLGALSEEACEEVLRACHDMEREMLRHDPERLGCRDPGRYSFGAAAQSGALLHLPAWRHLLDCEAVLAVLDANFQALHSDLGPSRVPPGQRADWPPPKVAVNFSVQRIDTAAFGPMRALPARKTLELGQQPPPFAGESDHSRRSTLFPLPAGAAVLRDLRVWHGGTPNLTAETRFSRERKY
ncbi:unnamed protein product, partial [Prorocentrum cordatum]